MKTLLKFEADWCGPCQQVKSVVAEVLKGREDIALQVVDIDDEANLALVREHAIRSVPTFVLKSGNEVVATTTGAMSQSQLEAFLAT